MVKENTMKQTEIGLLPDDWEIESIGNLTSKIIGGGTPSRIVKEYWNGKIPWMTVKDFTSFNPNFTQENITELGLKNSATRIVSAGNLIIATRIALGKIVKYNVDVTINQDLKTINLFPKINKDYFIYSYRNIEEKIIEKGSGSTVLGLSVADLNSFQIPLPPLPEQEAIAEALSDADAWIESLEQLIAKKRLIKQGAMQELLTPKEDWEVKKLGEMTFITKLAGFEYSLHFNSYRDKGDIIVIRGTNITKNKLDLSDIKTIQTKTSNYLVRSKLFKNDLVFAYVGTIGPIYLVEENDRFHLGPNTAKITVNKDLNSKYLYHYFTSSFIKNEIKEHTSIGAQPSLSMSKIRSFTLNFPSLTEQTRIATVLSDMDAELEALEGQLSKARKVKQGMMQELLTGRVRLI